MLELYTWSVAYCPSDALSSKCVLVKRLNWLASEVTVIPADMLRVDLLMHTDRNHRDDRLLCGSSRCLTLESGEKVAQGDQGLWLGRYNPLRSEIDISGLMAGEYELRVGVYNWQTLERLEGVDLTGGATAFLLTLYRFRVE